VVEENVNGDLCSKLLVKTLGTGDTQVTISGSSTVRRSVSCVVLRNVLLGGTPGAETPHAVARTLSGSATGTRAAPSVAIGSTPSTVVAFFADRLGGDFATYDGAMTLTAPSSMTAGWSVGNTGIASTSAARNINSAVAYDTGVDAVTGTIAPGNWVGTRNTAWTTEFHLWTVAIRAV
jgi:hypothetical protein